MEETKKVDKTDGNDENKHTLADKSGGGRNIF